MRLIDADELLKRVDEERQYLLARGQTGAEHILVHNFRDLIVNAPTVEQVDDTELQRAIGYAEGYSKGKNERPHGEWLEVKEEVHYDYWTVCECSLCKHSWALGELSIEDIKDDYKFCPNCGADMREADND